MCFAKAALPQDQPSKPPPSFYCSYAKELAANYAHDIKEKYAEQTIDKNYILARHKYQVAAAKFAALRSSLELDIVVGKNIPNINGPKYETAIEEAYEAFLDFDKQAQEILGVKSDIKFRADSVKEIIDVVSKVLALWFEHKDNQKERLGKLQIWMADCFQWASWNDISVTKPAAHSNEPRS